MKKTTAERMISAYQRTIKISSPEAAKKYEFLIMGLEHETMPTSEHTRLHLVRCAMAKSTDPVLRHRGEWYLKGIAMATSCRRGPRVKGNVLLYHVKVDEKVADALELIRSTFKMRSLADVRNAAYRMYIEFMSQKTGKEFLK